MTVKFLPKNFTFSNCFGILVILTSVHSYLIFLFLVFTIIFNINLQWRVIPAQLAFLTIKSIQLTPS